MCRNMLLLRSMAALDPATFNQCASNAPLPTSCNAYRVLFQVAFQMALQPTYVKRQFIFVFVYAFAFVFVFVFCVVCLFGNSLTLGTVGPCQQFVFVAASLPCSKYSLLSRPNIQRCKLTFMYKVQKNLLQSTQPGLNEVIIVKLISL